MAINKTPVPDARLNVKIRARFLDHLAETANVSASARAAGVASSAVYAERRRSPAFRDAWALALAEGYASAQQAPAHPIGSQVLLMGSAAALTLSATNFVLGQTVFIEAQGIGDAIPASHTATVQGRAIMPLPPVHGRAIRNSDGSFKLEWKRCSRLDLGWVDGVDQALVEDQESYRVAILANAVVLREWLVAANNLHVSAGEMAATGMAQNALPIFHVWHIGRFAQSDPLIFGVSQDFHN